jgi:cyclopropane fatty-acyl-phospholipid synthase-like methyltransferase
MKLFRKLLLFDDHVCPWWLAYTFDNPLRRLIHNPEKIVGPYLEEGMTAIDIGCGMGYFSLGMARLVGAKGRVISVDLQQKMLDKLKNRAEHTDIADRISVHLCKQDTLGVSEEVDFVLTFWMVHEVPSVKLFFEQIHSILHANGKWLLAEPKLHTSLSDFDKTLSTATEMGFLVTERPVINISYAAVLEKAA